MWIISFSKLLITNRIVSLFDYKVFLKFYSFDDALLTWNIYILLRSCSFNTASLTWNIPAVRTASSGSSYVLNTYYGYLYSSYISDRRILCSMEWIHNLSLWNSCMYTSFYDH
ncbi:uncharacterized protein LOC105681393 isoform X1 [Bombus impatiens]|uniref:Uncharacterized protein LOC105681393 isoform X1 n=1 Tax=Bombus impatiens TaxID=132113 RepID=A0A6P8LJI6_BOMIM|nr:uncharacterized protein LOC105681393 isoform X1 [Bombus impatiens]